MSTVWGILIRRGSSTAAASPTRFRPAHSAHLAPRDHACTEDTAEGQAGGALFGVPALRAHAAGDAGQLVAAARAQPLRPPPPADFLWPVPPVPDQPELQGHKCREEQGPAAEQEDRPQGVRHGLIPPHPLPGGTERDRKALM